MDADGAGGRLRDSTSRFFCTQEQLPRNQARSDFIENDGLLHTKRTSTVIGIGANPAQEIYSIGARENFTESQYAITRRESSLAAAPRSTPSSAPPSSERIVAFKVMRAPTYTYMRIHVRFQSAALTQPAPRAGPRPVPASALTAAPRPREERRSARRRARRRR